MGNLEFEYIHEKFKDIYENYRLIGSYKVYTPYYKVNFNVTYTTEMKLSVLEEYICKCITNGINKMDDISYSMGIKEDIVEYCTNELIKEKYLSRDSDRYVLTKLGEELFRKLQKTKTLNSNFEVYLNAVTGQYFWKSREESLDINKIINDKEAIILNTRKLAIYEENDFENISEIIIKEYLKKEDRVKSIILLNEKEIKYNLYNLLIYSSEKKYKMLACNSIGEIDTDITKTLQNLNDKNELIELMEENMYDESCLKLVEVLNNYENEFILEEKMDNIEKFLDRDSSLRYIMNCEIKRKFDEYLEGAQESLYIISPWLNYYIINKTFIDRVEGLLKKGVKVRIIYGISNKNEILNEAKDKKTCEIVNKLGSIAKLYGSLFKIESGETHEKLVICDRKFYINGSFNFLAYSGSFFGKFRHEGSAYSENKRLIDRTIKLRFKE